MLLYVLCFHVYCQTGFELDRDFVIVDRDLFDHAADECLTVFRLAGLFRYEADHSLYPVNLVLPKRRLRENVLPPFAQGDDPFSDFLNSLLVLAGIEEIHLTLADHVILDNLRTLSALNPPVSVEFETEGITYTGDGRNNLLISLLAALAEMESQQKSEAIKAGIRWRMAEGIYKFSVQNTLGFYRDHFGRLVIEPTEARIVEYIYESCLEGATPAEIAAALTEQGIKSPMGNDLWSAGTVRSILRNEKYCGDALMQKTYTKDFRTHKSVKNTDLNMYFKENHHTAIIKKEDWSKAQMLLSERHSTAKRATLRRLSNHFVAYRVKDGLFKGYLIMDSRWSFMERQEFMKIVDEAQNTIK